MFILKNSVNWIVVLSALIALLISVSASASRIDDYRTVTVDDEDGLGMDAFTIDVPEDWDFNAEIIWYYDIMPVFTAYVMMEDPDETSMLALLPMNSYVWYSDPWLQSQMPEGTPSSDSTTVMRPMDADDYIEDILIPYLLDNTDRRIRNFEIVELDEDEDLARDYRELIDPYNVADYFEYEAAEAIVEFTEDGEDIEEKISVVIGRHDGEMIGLDGYSLQEITNWVVLAAVIQKAPLGELEDMEEDYEDILGSIEWDEDFLEEFWELNDWVVRGRDED